MQKIVLSILSAFFLVIGCGSLGDPISIDREQLLELPIYESPVHGFQFSIDPDVEDKLEIVLGEADERFDRLSDCLFRQGFIDKPLDPTTLRQYRIVIVAQEFNCIFHQNYCGGVHNEEGFPYTMFLAWDTPVGDHFPSFEEEVVEIYLGGDGEGVCN